MPVNRFLRILLIGAVVPFLPSRSQDIQPYRDFYLYSIGNSHTWDFRPSADFLEIGKALHIEIINGWHINCGQNLKTIWDKPGQTCVEPSEFGVYQEAIEDQKWDAITIQTFVGGRGIEEKEAIDAFLDLISRSINKDCDVFIYGTWPKNTAAQLGDFDYAEAWRSDFQKDDTLKVLSAHYFEYLENAIKSLGERVGFIPLGRVLYHFDQQARSGAIPGFSGAGDLYRDAWHLNNAGRYRAGLTVFSQIFRIDPNDIPEVDAYHTSDQWPSDHELTSAQKKLIKKMISEVLNF